VRPRPASGASLPQPATLVYTRAALQHEVPLGPSIETLSVGDAARKALLRGGLQMPSPYGLDVEDALCASLRLAAALAPAELVRRVRAFASDPRHKGALVVRGLPVDPALCPTPADGGRAIDKSTFVSESLLLGLTQLIGQPFGFNALKRGELVHNICPVRGSENSQSNEGSEIDFDFHIESAFSELRPAHLALFCLRADHDGAAQTTLISAQRAYDALPAATRAILRQPLYVTRAPESWKELHARRASSDPRPAIVGPEGMVELCANLQSTAGVTAESQQAMADLAAALHDPELVESVRLRPGDLLIIDNRKVLHGRTTFKARHDGHDRWLQRVYTVGDLWPGRSESSASRRVRDSY
jgi:L-asparagine oxygenase